MASSRRSGATSEGDPEDASRLVRIGRTLKRGIVDFLAFCPPKSGRYMFVEGVNGTLTMRVSGEWPKTRIVPQVDGRNEAFCIPHDSGERIACVYFAKHDNPKFTVITSHTNATDLGDMEKTIDAISLLKCNSITYDYRGFGLSDGRASDAHVKEDLAAVISYAVGALNIPLNKIILHGQSIGSVPSIEMACKYKVAGLILEGALSSALKIIRPNMTRESHLDSLRNYRRIKDVLCPTLIVHCTKDTVSDIRNAYDLLDNCPMAVDPILIDAYAHVNVIARYFDDVKDRITEFLNKDVRGLRLASLGRLNRSDTLYMYRRPDRTGGESEQL